LYGTCQRILLGESPVQGGHHVTHLVEKGRKDEDEEGRKTRKDGRKEK
jgi:hypothetical protein